MGLHCRGVGAGPTAKKLVEAKSKERGALLAEAQLAQMSTQLGVFKASLEELAVSTSRRSGRNPSCGCSSRTPVSPLCGSAPLRKRILVCDGGCGSFPWRPGDPDDGSVCSPDAQERRSAHSGGTRARRVQGKGPIRPGCQPRPFHQGHEETRGPGTGAGDPALGRRRLSSAPTAPRSRSWPGGRDGRG